MNQAEKVTRVLDLQKELDLRKALYAELDALVLELQADGFKSVDLEGFRIDLIDNFAERNTVFRPAGVKRFEIKVEALETIRKREARKVK